MKHFEGSSDRGLGRFFRRQSTQHNVNQAEGASWRDAEMTPDTISLLFMNVGSRVMAFDDVTGNTGRATYAFKYVAALSEQLESEDQVQQGRLETSEELAGWPIESSGPEPIRLGGIAEAARLMLEDEFEDAPLDVQATAYTAIGLEVNIVNGFIGMAYAAHTQGQQLPIPEVDQSRVHPGL